MDITTLSKSELIGLLYAVTGKAKKKSALPPKDDGSREDLQKENQDSVSWEKQQQSDFGRKTKWNEGPMMVQRNKLEGIKLQLPSAGQKTPRVMPGSRVDINKQNRDAAANQKKATLNKRSDFHAMKVNEAKMKRRKELQSEQAIDQYLSYESEMDSNRQLMFEVITEKARNRGNTPPTPTPGQSAAMGERSLARYNKREAQTEQSRRDRVRQGVEKKSEGDRRRDYVSLVKANNWMPEAVAAGKVVENHNPKDSKVSKMSGAEVYRAAHVDTDANRRRKELDYSSFTEKARNRGNTPPTPKPGQSTAKGKPVSAEANKRDAQTEQSRRDRVRQGVEKKSYGDYQRKWEREDAERGWAPSKYPQTEPKIGRRPSIEVYRAAHVDTDANRRRKELDYSSFTGKARKRSVINPMGGDGNDPDMQKITPRYHLNDDATPYRQISVGRKTPQVFSSTADIKKQNRDAAAAANKKKKATMKPSKAQPNLKELQFDPSLVVDAESFFLQMIASTNRK